MLEGGEDGNVAECLCLLKRFLLASLLHSLLHILPHPSLPPCLPSPPREMTQTTFEVNDFFGWFAGKFEWFTLWLLAADENGLVTKEAVRSVYDGSLFYKMEVGRDGGRERGRDGR